MTTIPFWKMSGAGNDFILIDNRQRIVVNDNLPHFAAQVCRRRLSVGADGLILIETSNQADFKWQFFNSDGSVAEMCGNGARCAARFAHLNGITSEQMTFETIAGVVEARVTDDQVKIKMTDPRDLIVADRLNLDQGVISLSRVNTGVPHVVLEVEDIDATPVFSLGRQIRQHPHFAPAGTNVNFIAPMADDRWAIRTYERGVENETLACGTGVVAAALVLSSRKGLNSPRALITRSNSILKVYFTKTGHGYREIYLEGDARKIYEGNLNAEASDY